MLSAGKIMFSSAKKLPVSVVFDTQPESVEMPQGWSTQKTTATFSVSARSIPDGTPLTYQWYRLPNSSGMGVFMTGENSPTLNLSGLTRAVNSGDSYRCRVTAGLFTFSSSAAELFFGNEDNPTNKQKVFGCGLNNQYGLGDGTNISRPWMVAIHASDNNFSGITSGARHGFFLKSGELWGWGESQFLVGLGVWQGQEVSSPVRVGSALWSRVSAGGDHTLAIQTNGSLWGWGLQSVDDGRAPATNSPQLIMSGSWSKVSAGGDISYGHSAAIASNGSLWTWGRNNEGQLGLGNTSNQTSPTKVSDGWSEVSCGGKHTLGIKSNGTLWGWGHNQYGQVGAQGAATAPLLLDGGTWTAISAGSFNSLAIKSDGSLWSWGLRTGDGTTDISYAPKKIGSKSWFKISAGTYGSVAIDSDKRLWTWGDNFQGTLSNDYGTREFFPTGNQGIFDSQSVAVLEPRQVDSGPDWREVDCGGANFMAIGNKRDWNGNFQL